MTPHSSDREVIQMNGKPLKAQSFAPLAVTVPALLCLSLILVSSETIHIAAPAMVLPQTARNGSTQPTLAAYAKFPLHFEANEGQTDPRVKFLARGNGYTLFLTRAEAVLVLSTTANPLAIAPGRPVLEARESSAGAVLRMKFHGAELQTIVQGHEELSGKSHYLLGNDSTQWRRDVSTFAKVRYVDLYPGIDLVFYGRQGHLEYDLVVSPGADPMAIRLDFEGAESLRLDGQGDIVLQTSVGAVHLRKPIIYQGADGARTSILGDYRLIGTQGVGFQIAAYDAGRPLIIDPVLTYSTYLGGPGDEGSRALTLDSSGSVYVAGITTSVDFPRLNPFQPSYGGSSDAFVAKLDPSGTTLVYATYLGGSGIEAINAIAVDASGNAYVTGLTASPNFPKLGPIQDTFGGGPNDGFVAKVNPAGSGLVYSTYLGGSALDLCNGIALDRSGNAYVSCRTASANLPATPGAFQTTFKGIQDGFVAKVDATGSALVYLTYLGGSGDDFGRRIAVDGGGRAHVVGRTGSSDFPTTQRAFRTTFGGRADAFITKLNASGSALDYSTYLGGSSDDEGSGLALDGLGNAYVTGWTGSTDFPTTARGFQRTYGGGPLDVFVTKLEVGGFPVYSTFLGGIGEDLSFFGLAVDRFGNAHVTGSTTSVNFPLKRPLQGTFGGGAGDIFVTKLNASGSGLTYSTFLGGSGAEFAQGIAIDRFGNVYISGGTNSNDFPTMKALQPRFAGGPSDVVVVKISDPVSFGVDVREHGEP